MNHLPQLLIKAGIVTLGLSLFIFALTFYPIIKEELNFYFENSNLPLVNSSPGNEEKILKPIDEDFGIIIPKIKANAKILPNIDPFNSQEYQTALTQGVAHAKGTGFPDKEGNIFLFSHSSTNFYEANRYNSIFYLLYKLEKGDEINLYYHGKKYVYLVSEKKVVEPQEIGYLTKASDQPTVTLMTCWPPGTNLKRLIVIGKAKEPTK